MINSQNVKYRLEFCHPFAYADFVQGVRNKASLARVCYLGIENLRMFLGLKRGAPTLEFYQRKEKSWEHYTRPPVLRELNLASMVHSSQGFESELAETFFQAFPKAEEAFYETLPKHKEVLARLQSSPTLERIQELLLVCHFEGNVAVDDADGIATISCDDGRLCIPYDVVGNSKTLQMYRAKFHPDAPVLSFFEELFDRSYALWSRISSVTLHGVLLDLDKIVK